MRIIARRDVYHLPPCRLASHQHVRRNLSHARTIIRESVSWRLTADSHFAISEDSLNPAAGASRPSGVKPKELIFKEARRHYHRNESARDGPRDHLHRRTRGEAATHQSGHSPLLSCSYLPRTRMRMLNRSAVLNGQPAILAWSVTSIQLPPETIQACPINQPIRYPGTTPISPLPLFISFSPLPLPLPPLYPSTYLSVSLYLSLHPFISQTLPIPSPRHSGFVPPSDLCPTPVPRWQTARSSSRCQSCFPVTVRPHPAYTPILHAPYRQFFFFSPSRIRAWGPVRSMKVLPDGTRRATYIIVKHAMRTTAIGNVPLPPSPHLAFARAFFRRSTRADAEVLDLVQVL